ncbi:MAG: DEAD/DEAH box helicase, partial [Myxococcota bacterium]
MVASSPASSSRSPVSRTRVSLLPVVPLLRVHTETLVLPGEDWSGGHEEADLPVLSLSFVYANARGEAQVVRAADPGEEVYLRGSGIVARQRDDEDRCRLLLESFGAVELGCLENVAAGYDSTADYLVRVDGDVHAFCNFGAYALPQLRKLGWRVEVDEDYPYRLLSSDTPWYASLDEADEESDWFNLELGVQLKGERISLLPALVDLIERSPDDGTIAAIARGDHRFFALPVGTRHDLEPTFLPVPAKRLTRVIEVVKDLYERNPGPDVKFRMQDAETLAELDDAFDEGAERRMLEWRGRTEVRVLGEKLRKGPTAGPPPLVGLQATLRPYQAEGVAWLQHLASLGMGGVLADDMGLGKTLQTIAHLLAQKEAGKMIHPCLVVAPTSLVGGWKREIEKFAPSLKTLLLHGTKRHKCMGQIADADVVITTYALLYRDREQFNVHRYHYVVLDEAQAIKNHRSQAHQAVALVDCDHRLCLTGTPLENHIGELLSLFHFLMPGMLGRPEQLRERYRVLIAQGDETRLAELQRRVSPFILRRLKSEVAKDLPSKTEVVRPVELPDEQRELYESIRVAAHADVRRLIRKKGLAASTVPVLDALMKLRQVCCDPRLVRVAAARSVKKSAKLDVCLELVENQLHDGHRILIFSQFTSMLSLISEGLAQRGIKHLSLTGSTQNRQAKVDAFQGGDADVFLISLKAGGTGLTLTRADTVIHYDPWWNPAAQAQATDRAYRIGQKSPVFVYNLIVAGSVEERMLRLQERKRQLASAILGHGTIDTRLG